MSTLEITTAKLMIDKTLRSLLAHQLDRLIHNHYAVLILIFTLGIKIQWQCLICCQVSMKKCYPINLEEKHINRYCRMLRLMKIENV